MTESEAFITMLNYEETKIENESNKETSSTMENDASKSVDERDERNAA